jgi:carbamate kinase
VSNVRSTAGGHERPRVIVVALGGNAILQEHEAGTAEQQAANLERACSHLVPLIRDGNRVIITHGNGPQVGNLLVQQVQAADLAPMQPMDVCVGMTQGQVGPLLERILANRLRREGVPRDVVVLVSHVLVDPEDPELQRLTKPVGPFVDAATRDRLTATAGFTFRELGRNPDRPFRRVVPSPRPLRLIETRPLRALSEAGAVVIAGGGGGVPVVLEPDGSYRSIEAVIDKDLTAEKVAESVAADLLLILTDVDRVAVDYGKPTQRNLDRLTLDEARRFLEAGEFGSGSMQPKVTACIEFVEYGGEAAIIAGLGSADRALRAEAGTRIERGP